MVKTLIALKSGALRSLNIWKGILIVWILSLLLTSMIAVPMKKAINAGLGNSMITERLEEGLNAEVFVEMGPALKSLVSFFTAGLLFSVFVGFLLNTFLTGGLFNSIRNTAGRFSPSEFFRASSKNFWSYLIISVIISLIAILLATLVIVVPFSILSKTAETSDVSVFKNYIILFSVFIIFHAVVLLVADYARAWQASTDKRSCFRAIGFGFSRTFRTFFSSWPLMIIYMLVRVLFVWLLFIIISDWKPVTGGGVFLLFLVSQFLFFVNILIKSWRYSSVTSLMELQTENIL